MRFMTHLAGFVLFSSMLMLTTLTVLVLSLMQGVLLYVKATHQQANRHKAFYRLESAVHATVHGFKREALHCTIKEKWPAQVIDRLKRGQGCLVKRVSHSYLYTFEDLGYFPCLHIEGKSKTGSHHWRITMMDKDDDTQILQVRFVKPEKSIACARVPNIIHNGIVSWQVFF